MKDILVTVLLAGSCVCLQAQQWCFSGHCRETKATMFSPSNEVESIFRPLAALPAYTPIAPLRFSPSTSVFFRDVHPLENNMRIPPALNVTLSRYQPAGGGRQGTSRGHSAMPGGPSFSTGQIGFTPGH